MFVLLLRPTINQFGATDRIVAASHFFSDSYQLECVKRILPINHRKHRRGCFYRLFDMPKKCFFAANKERKNRNAWTLIRRANCISALGELVAQAICMCAQQINISRVLENYAQQSRPAKHGGQFFSAAARVMRNVQSKKKKAKEEYKHSKSRERNEICFRRLMKYNEALAVTIIFCLLHPPSSRPGALCAAFQMTSLS